MGNESQNQIPEISCEETFRLIQLGQEFELIDVRRPEEYNNELGHIQGTRLLTLGPQLTKWSREANRSEMIIFVCRSGVRSATSTLESLNLGFSRPFNMVGGMLRWNELQLPVERS